MLELAYFFGWTLDYIRTMTMYDLNMSREFMNSKREQERKASGK